MKLNALRAACEAACLILSIDETVQNPESEQAQAQGGRPKPMGGGTGGQGMMGMMKNMPGGMKKMKGMAGK